MKTGDLEVARNTAARCSGPSKLPIAILLLLITVFYVATIRAGHIWGDDFAMYVHHAMNVVEHRPYADTGYIFNPTAPVSPRMYPPVFPLLLAPVYKVYGLNLIPMKAEQVLFFVLALLSVFAFWKDDLGRGFSLALVGIVGFSPIFWAAKDNVLSDLPFLLFFYLAALLVHSRPKGRIAWAWSALIGTTLYLAIGTRTAGIALVAGFVLFELMHRAIARLAIALTICAALAALQSYLIGAGIHNYDGHFHPTWHTIATNVVSYPRALAGFWVASVQNAFSFVILGIVALLTAAGAYFRYRQGLTIIEAFLVPYLAIAILWPFTPGIRLLFPVIPWMIFLALYGLRGLTAGLQPRYSVATLVVLVSLLAVPYTIAYYQADFGPIRQSNGAAEFNSLCDAVRADTSPGDVLIYFRARALALYTGRQASSYNHRGTEQELTEYANTIHATHLITTDSFDEDHGFLARFVADHSSSVELIYQNLHFKLYRIVPLPDRQITSQASLF